MSALTLLTYVLPHRLLSGLARRLAYSTNPKTKQWLIDTVSRKFGVDHGEAAEPDPTAYPSFNAFFTRALRPGARVADPDPAALLMPADGRISQCGHVSPDGVGDGRIFQAKGQDFTRSLSLVFMKVPGDSGQPNDYSIDHSAALVLLDPQARMAGVVQPPLDIAGIASDLTALTQAAP